MRHVIRKAAWTISPLALFVCAATGVTATEASASIPHPRYSVAEAADTPCQPQLQQGQWQYRHVRFRRGTVKSGAKLSTAARLQCEPDLVCSQDGTCALNPGKLVRRIAVRRLRGIEPRLAIINAKSDQVYVNRKIFPVSLEGKRLLKLLRHGGGPQRSHSQGPPDSELLATSGKRLTLALGDYCWSKPMGGQTWAQGCATTAGPSTRFDLPLVTAEPGASLRAHLAVKNPISVRVSLLRGTSIYYSESLTASQAVTWTVPTAAQPSSYLLIEAERRLPGAPLDWVDYLARLQVADQVATG